MAIIWGPLYHMADRLNHTDPSIILITGRHPSRTFLFRIDFSKSECGLFIMGTQRDEMIFIMTPRDLKQVSCWANLRTHGVNSLFKLYLGSIPSIVS